MFKTDRTTSLFPAQHQEVLSLLAPTQRLALWGERIPNDLVLALLATPERGLCAAALDVIRGWPALAIPLETMLPLLKFREVIST